MEAEVSILVWFSLSLKNKNQWVKSIFDSRSSHFQALNTASQQQGIDLKTSISLLYS